MINCWEFKKCGREPGGSECDKKGVCPAAIDSNFDKLNHGKNAGRICWAVAGTLCGGKVQGIFALKIETCLKCDFFQKVAKEEDIDLLLFPPEELLDKESTLSTAPPKSTTTQSVCRGKSKLKI